MRSELLVAMAVLGLWTAGCAKSEHEGAVSALGADEASRLNAEHSKFESSADPQFTADTWYAAGQLAESQQATARAVECYRAGLKLDAAHKPSLYRLGILYALLRRYPEAIAAWEEYVKATADDATGYSNLGFCYELAGRPDEAEAAYKRGLARDAKSQPCRVNYGLMLARAGRTNEAIVQLQAVLQPSLVYYNLGSVYEQLGKIDLAKAAYRQALTLDPKSPAPKQRLAALE